MKRNQNQDLCSTLNQNPYFPKIPKWVKIYTIECWIKTVMILIHFHCYEPKETVSSHKHLHLTLAILNLHKAWILKLKSMAQKYKSNLLKWWWMKQANDDEWRNMQVLDYGWIGFDFRVKVCEEKKSLERMEKRKVGKRKWGKWVDGGVVKGS